MNMNRKSVAIGLAVGVLAGGTGGAIAATTSGAIGRWQTHGRDWDGGLAWRNHPTGTQWPGNGPWSSGTHAPMPNRHW